MCHRTKAGICARRPRRRSVYAERAKPKGKYWTQYVTTHSDALDLEKDVFTWSPKKIALSLKRSAEASTRRKTTPFRSAMSMLVFYMNRAGRNLTPEQRARLTAAKDELRKAFGRPPKEISR